MLFQHLKHPQVRNLELAKKAKVPLKTLSVEQAAAPGRCSQQMIEEEWISAGNFCSIHRKPLGFPPMPGVQVLRARIPQNFCTMAPQPWALSLNHLKIDWG